MSLGSRSAVWPVFALAGCLTVLAPALAAAQTASILVDERAQARMGLTTQTLSAGRQAVQIDAFAKVLDPGPLAQLESDLLAAEAAAAASKAEAQRARALFAAGAGIALKDEQSAIAQAEGDADRLALLQRRVGLEWGPGVARLSPQRRAALLRDLAAGTAALVHVDTPSNEGQAGARTVDIDVGSTDQTVHGVVLGPARAAEPRLQSSGLIVEVQGKLAVLLSVGLTQSAHINSASGVAGVVIPRSAVIRFQGSDWAYVRHGPTGFERRLIQTPIPQDKGLFTAAGFHPGEQVVDRGAAELFAVEQAQLTRQR
jgi:hypothetical protein